MLNEDDYELAYGSTASRLFVSYKSICVGAFLLILLPTLACGYTSWPFMTIEQLVRQSDIVVIGTLKEVDSWKNGMGKQWFGLIHVEEVLWGNIKKGAEINLRWGSYINHQNLHGKNGIWLLEETLENSFKADHPKRFCFLDHKSAVESALVNVPIFIKMKDHVIYDIEPLILTIVYRNADSRTREFPGLKYDGSSIVFHPTIKFVMRRGEYYVPNKEPGKPPVMIAEREVVPPIQGKVDFSVDVTPITLKKNESIIITIDMREFYEFEYLESYSIQMEVEDISPFHEIRFTLRE